MGKYADNHPPAFADAQHVLPTTCCDCSWDFTRQRREVRTMIRVGENKVRCDVCNRARWEATQRYEKAKAKPEPIALQKILDKLGIDRQEPTP